MSTTIAVTVSIYGVIMALSPTLQIVQMVKRRTSAGISISYFSVLAVGFVLWTLYGISREDSVILVVNIVAAAIALTTISAALWLHPRRSRQVTVAISQVTNDGLTTGIPPAHVAQNDGIVGSQSSMPRSKERP